jgi:sugar phosphate isomerase/epimerase
MNDLTDAFVFNTTAAKHSTLTIEIDIAHKVGFSGIETTAAKVQNYLDVGHSVSDLHSELRGLPIYGIGTIVDIERHRSDYEALMADAERIFCLANKVGARAVQVINGPLDCREVVRFRGRLPRQGYSGVLEYNEPEQIEITATNLRLLAQMGQEAGVIVYLEALAWSPLNTVKQQLALVQKANHQNLKIVIDFWHCFASGDHPEDIAKIDKDLIYGVHVCDSLPIPFGEVPNETVLRDVQTGNGVIDLRAWTDAVKATGYKNWWCSETFCKKTQQQNSYLVATQMKKQLWDLIR